MDSAVASLFCTGVVNLHSTGLGGGGFLVYYNRQSKTSEVYNFRETAPAASSETMYLQKNMSSTTGNFLFCFLLMLYLYLYFEKDTSSERSKTLLDRHREQLFVS